MYRKRNRIKNYDYSQPNVYLLTLCTENRANLFGVVESRPDTPVTVLSPLGELVQQTILDIETYYTNASFETYSILPNHLHILLRLDAADEPNAPTISRIVKNMKEHVTRVYGKSVWQKGFHDHVIRSELEYQNAWNYVTFNPAKWETDEYFVNE